MIQEAFTYVDQITDMDTKLKLIDTLITVTSGKVRFCYASVLLRGKNFSIAICLTTNSINQDPTRYDF